MPLCVAIVLCNVILVVFRTVIRTLLCNACVVAAICQAPRTVFWYVIFCMVCANAHTFFIMVRHNVSMMVICEICVFAALCMVVVVRIALVVYVPPWPAALP